MRYCTYGVQKQEVRLAQVGFGIISLDMITIPSPDPYRQKRCFLGWVWGFLYYYYSKQTKVSISSGACISSAAFFESSAKLGILALLWAIVCCALESALLLICSRGSKSKRIVAMPFSSMLCDVISLRSNAWSEEEAKEWELSSSTKEWALSLSLSLKIWKPETSKTREGLQMYQVCN